MKHHKTNRQLQLFKIYAYQYWVNYCKYSKQYLKNGILNSNRRRKYPRHIFRKFIGGKVIEIFNHRTIQSYEQQISKNRKKTTRKPNRKKCV